MPVNDTLLEDLILYVVRSSQADERFGKTKLFKLLFFIDFEFARTHGRTLSGSTYKHWEHGPVPIEALDAIDRLVRSGALARAQRNHFGRTQETFFALHEPSLDRIRHHIELIGEVIGENWNLNASEIREKSHQFIGYELTAMHQTIPVETAAYASEPLSEEDIAAVRALNREFGWTSGLA